MARSTIAVLIVALLATAVFAVPEDIAANRPQTGGAPIPDSLQGRIQDRYNQAQNLISQLQTSLNTANMAMDKLSKDLDQNDEDVDGHWILFGIPIVIGVVIGYSFLEAGNVRSVNVVQVLMKNVLIAAVTAFVWWAVGYGFAFGDNRDNGTANGFIGNGKIFLNSDKKTPDPSEYAFWTYTWSYAVMAGIIASQSLGERTRTPAYIIITVLFVGFIYPVVAHWCWSTTGWVSPHVKNRATFARTGVIDRAGSGVVHITAGFSALAATLLLRGRQGRFDEDYQRQFPQKFRGSNKVYQGIGAFLLWVSWYGVTVVSPEARIHGMGSQFAAKTTINTTLAAAFGILVAIVVDCLFEGKKAVVEGEEPSWRINILRMINGAIAGLVAISAGCHVVEPWGAMFIGALGALFYVLFARLVIWARIDDPLETFATHGVAGVTGLTAVGWFARLEDVTMYYNWTLDDRHGIWYGGNAGLWGVQWITAFTIICWSLGVMAFFYLIMRLLGLLRVSFHVEAEGIDSHEPICAPKEDNKKKDATK